MFYSSIASSFEPLIGCGGGSIQQAPTPVVVDTPSGPNTEPSKLAATFDVLIYGGTPAGVIAGLAAANEGLKVGLVEPTNRVGGALANGLAATDCLNLAEMGGLARTFFQDISIFYKNGTNGPARVFEPHVAEGLLTQYLEQAKISVFTNSQLSSVYKSGSRIDALIFADGTAMGAAQWIDASYEGDLMAMSGVAYALGRESSSTYNESFAGWGQGQIFAAISPYQSDNTLIPDIPNIQAERNGAADSRIMAYTFRACITDNPKNMRPFSKPTNYNPSRFEGLARIISANKFTDINQLVYIQRTIGRKANIVSAFQTNPLSTDYVGGSWNFPRASPSERLTIQNDHQDYVAGWLYFVANEDVIPIQIRAQMANYGLALDEFADNENWPRQMYIREARRLIGKYVVTQADIMTQRNKTDSICLGNWYIDCHYCSAFLASPVGQSKQSVGFDGFINKGGPGYQIPFRCILPEETQANNLSIVCCPSSSHVAFSSIRVEPTYMALGQAAGVAAALSIKRQAPLAQLNVSELQNRLLELGGVLT